MRLCRLIFIGGMLVSSTAAQAQPEAIRRGTTMIGGSASLSHQGGDLYESFGEGVTTIVLAPRTGEFIRDGQLRAIELDYTRQSQGGLSMWSLALAPSFTYVVSSESNVLPMIGGGARLLLIGTSQDGNSDTETGFGLFASGGAIILLNESVGATVEVRYFWDRFKLGNSSVTGSTILLSVGLAGFLN